MKTKKIVYRDVAKIHVDSIKTGFLPTLGLDFLTLMYRCLDESNSTILITEYRNDRLAGFVTGSLGKSSPYKLMFSHPFLLAKSLFPIVFNLFKLKKVLSILRHMSSSERSQYPQAELLTICINSDFRRQGVGKRLYNDLMQYMKSNSVNNFSIIVGEHLDANSFYVKNGARVEGDIEVHAGSKSFVYIQQVTD